MTSASMPTLRKGVRQLKAAARYIPIGTPTTDATEKAVITIPMAWALLSNGILSPTIDKTRALSIPPKAPVTLLLPKRGNNGSQPTSYCAYCKTNKCQQQCLLPVISVYKHGTEKT
jgi:hypothetical protein